MFRATRFTNAGLNMFRRVHQVQSMFQFLRERAPHYGPLAGVCSRSAVYGMRERPLRVRRHFNSWRRRSRATIQTCSRRRIEKSRSDDRSGLDFRDVDRAHG